MLIVRKTGDFGDLCISKKYYTDARVIPYCAVAAARLNEHDLTRPE